MRKHIIATDETNTMLYVIYASIKKKLIEGVLEELRGTWGKNPRL